MIPPPVYPAERRGQRVRVKSMRSAAHGAVVYLLRSRATGAFYLGCTTDMRRRLAEHNIGLNASTKSAGLWELIAYEAHPTFEAAKQRERMLKRRHRMRMFFTKRALAVPKGSAMELPRVSGGPTQVGG